MCKADEAAAMRDYRYELTTDQGSCGAVHLRVADGDGAASHKEVPANLFDYLELHAAAPPSEHAFADAPKLSLWIRRESDDTFYGYVVALRKGVRTEARVECAAGKPGIARVEYKSK